MNKPGTESGQPLDEVERLRRHVSLLEASEGSLRKQCAELRESSMQCRTILEATPG